MRIAHGVDEWQPTLSGQGVFGRHKSFHIMAIVCAVLLLHGLASFCYVTGRCRMISSRIAQLSVLHNFLLTSDKHPYMYQRISMDVMEWPQVLQV